MTSRLRHRRPSIRSWADELEVNRAFLAGILAGLGAADEPLTEGLKRRVKTVLRRARVKTRAATNTKGETYGQDSVA